MVGIWQEILVSRAVRGGVWACPVMASETDSSTSANGRAGLSDFRVHFRAASAHKTRLRGCEACEAQMSI